MNTKLENVQFFEAGYCTQFGFLTGVRTWKLQRFYAVFVYFEHPTHGPCLIDTGYSEHFYPATQRFPERLFRYLLPTRIDQQNNAASQLRKAGLSPESIQRVFITHFHIDHIGGLKCFPEARFSYRESTFHSLMTCSRRKQVHQGFLQSLLPEDFEQRADALPDFQETSLSESGKKMPIIDYWDDGSLQLVNLPGHAIGHFGAILNREEQKMFYIVDACWNMQVLRESSKLPKLTRDAQYNYQEYLRTQEVLRSVENENVMLACHCPETLQYVTNYAD